MRSHAPTRVCTAIKLLLIAICVLVPFAWAQKPEAGRYSQAEHQVKSSRGRVVGMRDGVRLSVDIYKPDAEGRFPAILSHTPYDNLGSGLTKRAQWFAVRGYVVVLSDVRGRYDSEGTWDPFTDKHKTDGYDLVEWIATQPWCNGNVGMIGGSYGGWTQWWTASQAPPHLKAIAPQVAPPSSGLLNAPYQNGILVSWVIDWMAGMAGRTAQVVGEGPYWGHTQHRTENMSHVPQAEIAEIMGVRNAPWFEKWIHNKTENDYWARNAYNRYDKIRVPSLNFTGWFDANYPGSPQNYQGMRAKGGSPEARQPKLIIGPWPHGINRDRELEGIDYGSDSLIDLDGLICRWFDYWLKDVQNGIMEESPVYVFVMGENQWHAEKDWPLPQTVWTKYFFASDGHANSLDGDGTLSTKPPSGKPHDAYRYDPATPTRSPFTGGHIDGPVDTRGAAAGDEVLVYTTPPLEDPIEVTGPISAKFYASTSARDTDWMVRLTDVYPDGRSVLLCDGVMRARYRDPDNNGAFRADRLSEIVPGQIHEYSIEFWRGTANLFQPGHRIRVEISSSYFPYYLPNLNTGSDNNALETKKVIAKQKIYHSTEYPSHVVLPVIPQRQD
jgi:putative CocE/NonD family hydrolase